MVHTKKGRRGSDKPKRKQQQPKEQERDPPPPPVAEPVVDHHTSYSGPSKLMSMLFSSGDAAATPASANNPADPIIGLDVGGTLFYFRLSKLMKCGSKYFVTRLEGRLDSETAYKDERGRKVIFLERSPSLFAYVRDYICTQKLNLPAASRPEDLVLRRNLREEAVFFKLPGLAKLLDVSQTFSPDLSNRGLFYWLGTGRGAKEEYENPYKMGVIEVTGWMDDEANEEEDMFDLARFARSRETFVHYQMKPEVVSGKGEDEWEIEQFSCLQWCKHANKRLPVVVDLKPALMFRPTHYSLRVSECMGLAGDWNFEGSVDGKTWEALHKAREDDNLCLEEGNDEIKQQLSKTLSFYNDHVQDDELSEDILLTILEQDYRHVWKLNPPPKTFYRYFRLIGASPEGEEDEMGCLHGEGLELFGDVYEE